METSITRRDLVGAAAGAAAVAVGAAAMAGTSAALASEVSSFDEQYDVVAIGIGFAGMVGAMSAADAGAKVLLVEKLPDGEAGGNSRVCGQMFLYSNGNQQSAHDYLAAMSGSRTLPGDIADMYSQGLAGSADLVAKYSALDKADFQDVATWGAPMDKMSPEYPEFPGNEDCRLWATHAGASDSYLYQAVRANLQDNYADKVEVWFESPAQELILDADGAVTGVVVDHAGTPTRVGAKAVLLSCGGFENDPDMMAAYCNLVDYRCIGALGNTGDGIRMAQQARADMWHMTSWAGGFGLAGLSWVTKPDMNAHLIQTLTQGPLNTGALILVGKEGRRWVNESETPRHGKVSNGNGQWLNPAFPDGVFAILDADQFQQAKDAEEISQDYVDQVIECASVAEAAEEIGCDADVLQKTLDDYNQFAAAGEDPQFARESQYMRAFEGDTLYLIPLVPAMLNTQGGPRRDAKCRVLGIDGEPIIGLYGAGELGGVTSQMYSGGLNVAECFITGDIAGAQAAAF